MKKSVDISVIVAMYNVESYIDRCLSSLANQTFENFEIIVVNDGSTDGSGETANSFANIYENVTVYNKTNGGLSSTRNYGLTKAKGQYVLFIDGDDFVEPTFLEKMYKQMVEKNLDVVISKFIFYYEQSKKSIETPYELDENQLLNSEQALNDFFIGKITGHVWNKLIKKDILLKNHLSFKEGIFYEDAPFTIKLLLICDRIGFVNEGLYYYVQREGAITKQTTIKHLNDHLYIFECIAKNVPTEFLVRSNENYQVFKTEQLFYNRTLMSRLDKEKVDNTSLKEYMQKFTGMVKSLQIKHILLNKEVAKKVKLKYILLKGNLFTVYQTLYLHLKKSI